MGLSSDFSQSGPMYVLLLSGGSRCNFAYFRRTKIARYPSVNRMTITDMYLSVAVNSEGHVINVLPILCTRCHASVNKTV